MTKLNTVGTLEVGQDLAFQRRDWRMQRVGWGLLALVLVCAFLGLLGGLGPLNQQRAGSQQLGVAVQYDRFLRRDSHGGELQAKLFDVTQGKATFYISSNYGDAVQITSVVPQPESVKSEGDGYLYTFQASGQEATVHFYLLPENTTIGGVTATVGPDADRTVNFKQWVYF